MDPISAITKLPVLSHLKCMTCGHWQVSGTWPPTCGRVGRCVVGRRCGCSLNVRSTCVNETMAALLSRAVVHRDRCLLRYRPDSFQFKAAQRAVAAVEGLKP